MSDSFIGQIMMTGFSFAPRYYAQCNGQLLPVNQNQALFSLLGNRYGGTANVTFALPDLRGRTPVGYAPSVDPAWQPPQQAIATAAGAEAVALLEAQIPPHTHQLMGSSANGDNRNPLAHVFAKNANGTAASLYAAPGTTVGLSATTVGATGANQAHPNMQPYSTISFCIALQGLYPTRS